MAAIVPINLRQSICTDTPSGADLWKFGDPAATHISNTGLERNGGITPLYEKETTFPTAGISTMVAKDGTIVQLDAAHNIRLNNTVIGNVGPLSVTNRNAIKGYSDAAWSSTNTIIAIVKIGSAIKVDEINPSTMAVINTRSTIFAMPTTAITNVALIKYIGMNFVDSLQFIISNNQSTYILSESGSTISMAGGQKWTVRTLGSGNWDSVCWSPQLAIFVAVGSGAGTAATSSDGIAWSTRTIGAHGWTSVCWSPQKSIFVAVAQNAATTSPDGVTWTPQTIANGSWNSVIWSARTSQFVAVSFATTYCATSPDGVTWTTHASLASGVNVVAESPTLGLFIALGGTPYSSNDGATWTVMAHPAANFLAIAWSPQLSLFVAVGPLSLVQTSPDGVTWTSRSIATGTWNSVIWISQLSIFVALSNATNYAASSPDGINWTIQTLEADSWLALAWSPQLSTISAVGFGVTHYAATAQQQVLGSNIGWKFSSNNYLIGNQGVSGSFSIGDVAGTLTAITDATWAVIDQFAGTAYSRAILTFPLKKNASNLLTGIGEVGYNQTGTYTATPTYYGIALAAVTISTTINGTAYPPISGPGYSEGFYTRSDTGTNIYYYQAPIMQHNPGAWFDNSQSQTPTFANGYGRLSDFNGNALGYTCSLRSVMVNGQPSLISAGILGNDASYDCLGVPITNVGEFDETFMPHVVDNGSSQVAVIYRYNGVLFFFTIGTAANPNALQQVSDNLYTVNCLSPANAIDIALKSLTLGVNDYNGRILLRSSGGILAQALQIVGLMQGLHANSIDFGVKIITQTFATTSSIVPGIELPSFIDRAISDFGVNIYLQQAVGGNEIYLTTYDAFNVVAVNGNLANSTYLQDTRDPIAMGYTYFGSGHVAQSEVETFFTGVTVSGVTDVDFDYLGYMIGNDVTGQFQGFQLYGQTYLFDGNSIWIANFSFATFQGKGNAPLANAAGMQFIAVSPLEAFFLSGYDNSLYSFNGGRSLDKQVRMNDLDLVTDGVYSTRDDALLLNGTNSLIWVNDKIFTAQPKKTDQAGILGLYDTTGGIVISNNTTSWNYSFFAQAGATVVPLTWQSPYFTITENRLGTITAFFITLYSKAQAAISVDITVDGFDQGATWHEDHYFTINPGDWDSMGFWRSGRVVPEHTLNFGVSVGIQTTGYVTINRAEIEVTPDMVATPQASRSS